IRAIPDANARATGIRLGELDVAFPIGFESGEMLRREPNITVNANQGGIIGTLLDPWGVDGTNVGPIQDRRVRQAINYAVDRETLSRTIYRGLAEPAGLVVRPGVFGANPDVRPYTFDRNRARQLLAEAGYPNGFRIQMEVLIVSTEINSIALYLQDQLRQVGIEVDIQPVDAATFVDKIYKRRPIAPIYLGGLGTATDADSVLRWFWSENTAFGKRYNNPEFDRLYVQSTTEMDPVRREALLRQLVQIVQDDPPWMGLVVSTSLLARLNTVDGLVPRAFENDFFLMDRVRRIR
ncbi:MAG: ABC transporter substrate-binding protein, partial [Dehalococcoidia bacterium]|nr:ABC transporter substrate-binding protein [Dehalococcoidia bacterium]